MSNAKPIETTIEQIAESRANGANRDALWAGIIDSISQLTLDGIEDELFEEIHEEECAFLSALNSVDMAASDEEPLYRRFMYAFENTAKIVADEAKTEYEHDSFDFHVALAAMRVAKSALASHIEGCAESRMANCQPGGIHYKGKPNLFIH